MTTATTESGTPQWLLTSEFGLCPCGCIGKRSKGSFVEKTLRGGSGLLRQVMFAEDNSAKNGLLQRIDPRSKVIGLLALVVVAALLHTLLGLAVMYALALGLATTSGLGLGFFVKRVWLFIPIFTGIVVLPAMFSFITPGDIVLTTWYWHGHPEGFTAQGLQNAGLLVLRVAVSVSLVVLLTLTTSWSRLLAGLRGIGVPKMLILVIGMAYRYLFHLLGSVQDMYEARKARTVGPHRHDRRARAFVAAGVGAMIGKTHQMAEEVHQAMTARGFAGDAKTLDRFRFGVVDALWLLGVVVVAVLVLGGETVLG